MGYLISRHPLTVAVFTFGLAILVPTHALADTHERARLKAEYETMSKWVKHSTGDTVANFGKYMLHMSPTKSYYVDPQTYRIDSLENDPEGKKWLKEADMAAYETSRSSGKEWFNVRQEMGITRGSRYKAVKDFEAGKIIIWDSAMGDVYRYEVPMEELRWELVDSTKNVLGYECHMATADYHGRKWIAWFAPDVASSDGPWQLCGLPGLIMEAITADGEYGFTIKALQQCDEPLKQPFEKPERTFNSKRIRVLQQKDYIRRNRAAHVSAMTGGAVNIKHTEYKENIDYIETDYHKEAEKK